MSFSNRIFFFADDAIPRWITSGVQLDGTTIAGGDKFGNIYTLRLPEHVERVCIPLLIGLLFLFPHL